MKKFKTKNIVAIVIFTIAFTISFLVTFYHAEKTFSAFLAAIVAAGFTGGMLAYFYTLINKPVVLECKTESDL